MPFADKDFSKKKPTEIPKGKQLFSCDWSKTSSAKKFLITTYKKVYQDTLKHVRTGANYYEDHSFNNKIKLHIDIDINETFVSSVFRRERAEPIMNEVIESVNNKLKEEFEIEDPGVIVLISDTLNKLSLHIIYPDVIFESIYDMGYFMKDTCRYYDPNIYKKGCFRMLWSSKLGKKNKLEYFRSLNYKKPKDDLDFFLDTCLCHTDIEDEKIIKNLVTHTVTKAIKKHGSKKKYLSVEDNYFYRNYDLEKVKDALVELSDKMKHYNKWLIITTCVKDLWLRMRSSDVDADRKELYRIYNKVCSKVKGYDKENNKKIFESLRPVVDINYIFHLVGSKYFIGRFYNYRNIMFNIDNHKNVIKDNSEFIDVKIKKLLKYKDIYLKSPCGTGKTTILEQFVDKCGADNIISIVSRVNLANHHSEKLGLVNYKKLEDSKSEEYLSGLTYKNCKQIVVQMESLSKCNEELFRDGLVILDEVNSLLAHLRSPTLDKKRTACFCHLHEIIKNAKYVIALDADLCDWNVQFLQSIRNNDYILYINETKKNLGINSLFYKCDKTMISMMADKIKNNIPFVACFDSLKRMKVTMEYLKKFGNQDKFLAYSSEHKYETIDTKEWVDKFVFYSPTILYGIDFNEKETDVFCFVYKNHLNAMSIYQMLSRCRKPKTVNVYCDKTTYYCPYKCVEDTMDEYEIKYRSYLNIFDNIHLIMPQREEVYKIMYFNHKYFDSFLRSNNKEYLLDMMEYMGYKIKYDNSTTKVDLEYNKVAGAVTKDELISLLKLDKNNMTDFEKRIASSSEEYKKHLNLTTLLRRNALKLAEENIETNILMEAVDSTEIKIFRCQEIMNLLNIPSLDKLTKQNIKTNYENIEKIESEWLKKQFDTIKLNHNLRGSKYVYTDHITYDGLYSALKTILGQLFDGNLFEYDRMKANKKQYRILVLNENVYNQHLQLIQKRQGNHNLYQDYEFDSNDLIHDYGMDDCGEDELEYDNEYYY